MSERRLQDCVEVWPDCRTGDYDPRCCRFPKSCSCTIWDERYVTESDLEPAPPVITGTATPTKRKRQSADG